MCVLYVHLMRRGPDRGEEKPEGRQLYSHWWKLQLSLWSASLVHYFLSFQPLYLCLFCLCPYFYLHPIFCFFPSIHSLFPFNLSLYNSLPPIPQHFTPLHANSVAPFVPILSFNLLSSSPRYQVPGLSFPPSLSPPAQHAYPELVLSQSVSITDSAAVALGPGHLGPIFIPAV